MSNALVRSERQAIVGYVLWGLALFGFFGMHRFYAGRWISGIVWLLTFGLCGIGQLIDVLFIGRMIHDYNEGKSVW